MIQCRPQRPRPAQAQASASLPLPARPVPSKPVPGGEGGFAARAGRAAPPFPELPVSWQRAPEGEQEPERARRRDSQPRRRRLHSPTRGLWWSREAPWAGWGWAGRRTSSEGRRESVLGGGGGGPTRHSSTAVRKGRRGGSGRRAWEAAGRGGGGWAACRGAGAETERGGHGRRGRTRAGKGRCLPEPYLAQPADPLANQVDVRRHAARAAPPSLKSSLRARIPAAHARAHSHAGVAGASVARSENHPPETYGFGPTALLYWLPVTLPNVLARFITLTQMKARFKAGARDLLLKWWKVTAEQRTLSDHAIQGLS